MPYAQKPKMSFTFSNGLLLLGRSPVLVLSILWVSVQSRKQQNHGQFSVSANRTYQYKTGCSALGIYPPVFIYRIKQSNAPPPSLSFSSCISLVASISARAQAGLAFFWVTLELVMWQSNCHFSFLGVLDCSILWVFLSPSITGLFNHYFLNGQQVVDEIFLNWIFLFSSESPSDQF